MKRKITITKEILQGLKMLLVRETDERLNNICDDMFGHPQSENNLMKADLNKVILSLVANGYKPECPEEIKYDIHADEPINYYKIIPKEYSLIKDTILVDIEKFVYNGKDIWRVEEKETWIKADFYHELAVTDEEKVRNIIINHYHIKVN